MLYKMLYIDETERLKVTLNVNLAGFIYQLDIMVEHLLS